MRPMKLLASSTHHLLLSMITALSLLLVTPLTLADDRVEFSQAELDQMLAPIALYPDTILSQVLIAATYPIEVVQADRWARANSDLKAEDAVKFADNKDWDPSVKALVAFPDILKKMSEDLDWTQRVGDAFLSDEGKVMDTIQRLRKRAYANGSLENQQHMRVDRDDGNIVIEPAEERVVYVPVYDTRVVYGNWWWPDYPPVYWTYPASYVYASGFYWGASIYIGPSYYYSACRWHDRRVVIVDRDNAYYRHNEPHFYTNRSIVSFQATRVWSHDPVHRRGVAYYNDNLRDTYHSRHDSYEHDRVYRDQPRDHVSEPRRLDGTPVFQDRRQSGMPDSRRPDDRQNRNDNSNRAEQVREHLRAPASVNPPAPSVNPPQPAQEQESNRARYEHQQAIMLNQHNNQAQPSMPRATPDVRPSVPETRSPAPERSEVNNPIKSRAEDALDKRRERFEHIRNGDDDKK